MEATKEQTIETTPDELIDFRDPKTNETVKIPKSFQSLLNHVSEAARINTEKQLKPKYESQLSNSNSTLEELQARLQQLEDEKLSEKDKIKREADREIQKLRTALETTSKAAEERFNLFKNHKIENDLLSVIGDPSIGVANPSQVLALMKSVAQADLIQNENGGFETVLKINIDGELAELPPKDAITKFLSLPGNANLLKNSLKPGSGTTTGSRPSGVQSNQYNVKDFQTNPQLKTEYLERRRNGEAVYLIN